MMPDTSVISEPSTVSARERILSADKPPPHEFQTATIAPTLRKFARWVLWDFRWNKKKWAKVPVNETGRNIAWKNPKNHLTIMRAVMAARKRGLGIGFVINGDGIVGIDIDSCRDPVTGILEPWAMVLILLLKTYWEISPSGTGVKLWVRGTMPAQFNKKHAHPSGAGEVEIYTTGRFFTVTGLIGPDSPPDVIENQEGLTALYAAVSGWNSPVVEDDGTEEDYPVEDDGPEDSEDTPPSNEDPSPPHWKESETDDRETALLALTVIGNLGGVDYETWLNVGMALHSVGCTCADWVSWSRQSDKHADGECERKWASFTSGGGISVKTLCKLADDAAGKDWRKGIKRQPIQRGGKSAAFPHKPAVSISGDASKLDLQSLDKESGRTDVALARLFRDVFGHLVRYCHKWGKWLIWDGARWKIDESNMILNLAMQLSDLIWSEAANDAQRRLACRAASKSGISAMLELAKGVTGIPVTPDELDQNIWLLNTPSGTLDTRTGNLKPHDQADLITKLCPTRFNPDARCPKFEKFIAAIFKNSKAIILFVQKYFGMCLTGDVSEQILVVFWGAGANGKSTLVTVFMQMLGKDYCIKAVNDLLLAKRGESHSTERADLYGTRFAACVETPPDRLLDETLAKELTGGDKIRARKMREDNWEFSPTHKICISTNDRPKVPSGSHSIWRRLRLVPFAVKFWREEKGESGQIELKANSKLPAELEQEAEGILAWCVRGCSAWLTEGLHVPDEINTSTNEYKSSEDTLKSFLADQCIEEPDKMAQASELYREYTEWCDRMRERAIGSRSFGNRMVDLGFRRDKKGVHYYIGVGLISKRTNKSDDHQDEISDDELKAVGQTEF